jgi:EAL domain-containing protein (putative c-di-GMP-specific phosphodiesterase class I)
LHGPEFFQRISAALGEGRTWRGVVVNRTKGGELYEEDTTITPIRGDDGAVGSFVSVRRNISRERKLEADLDRLRSDRDSVVQAMGDVRVGATIEATAASFCEMVARLEDIHVARILLIELDGAVVPLGVTGTAYLGWEVGVPLTMARLPELIEVTCRGSWWLTLDDPQDGVGALVEAGLLDPLRDAGFRSCGFAPIWWEGRMVGVLTVSSRSPESERWRESRTGVLDELSSFAGQVLGTQAGRRHEYGRRRDEVRSIVAGRAFRPVFQPVVDLATGEVLGHEALTRFDSGRSPDLVIEDAHAVGLGVELETACADAAVRAAAALPAGGWLAVNLSPESVIAGSVRTVVAEADRPVVVEITEHVEVQSYGAVRAAIGGCPGVRIAVDDAGAGYASLRHILELQPDFVKLDIGLVRNIDTDPARQALAAGLHHYADQTGTMLIAEGVETPAERDALQRLGVPLAQGYLFGRPGPAVGPPGPEEATDGRGEPGGVRL